MAGIKRAQRLSELPERRRYNEVIADLRSGTLSDLAVAIIGGALADIVLLEMLEAYRKRRDPNSDDGFPSKIPREFGRRIELGARAGLYGRRVHKDLDAIRVIRNAPAHGLEAFDFADPEVSRVADNLGFAQSRFRYEGRRAPASPRERFVHAVEWVTDLLLTDLLRRSAGRPGEATLYPGGSASLKK
jgi:hypothetical protein